MRNGSVERSFTRCRSPRQLARCRDLRQLACGRDLRQLACGRDPLRPARGRSPLWPAHACSGRANLQSPLALLGLFALIVVAALCLLPAQAQARTIRVGYYEFAGYQMQDADGVRSGYGYDFLQEMARYTGWDYEYVGYDLGWADLQTMLDNGEIDILTSARKTPEREGRYLFSTEIGTSAGILTVKSGDTRVTAGDYATYEGLRVGMIKNSSINDNFARFAQEKGFAYTPVYFENVDELNAALQSGDGIDAVCTTNLRRVQNEWTLDQFDSSNFYAMMNANNTELQQEVNAAIAQMDLYTPGWRTTLRNRYYTPDVGDQISLTSEEKEFLASSAGQTFTVLVNPDNAPYSYFEDGQAKGIIPEIFDEVARRAGITFTYLETPDRASYNQALHAGTADIVADTIFDYDKAEKSGYKMTVPYLTTSVSQVSRKGLESSPTSLALLSEGDSTFNGQITIDNSLDIQYYNLIEACMDAVDAGKVDATYAYPYTIQRYLEQGDGSRLSVTLLPQCSVSFAVSVSNSDDDRLLTVLNKAVSSVEEDYVNQVILAQMTTSSSQVSVTGFLRQNPSALFLLGIVLAAFVALIVILVNRQRNILTIKEKNRELGEAVQAATEANEAKSNFLSSISHDMRTPLNGIIGFTNFALAESDGAKRQEDLEKIQRSSAMLLDLINDTLELSRIESGKFVLEPEWFSGGEFLDGILTVIGEEASRRRLTFIADELPGRDVQIHADRLKLQEVFLNLLSNAVKYTDAGGTVKLLVEPLAEDARDSSDACPAGYRIVVADTGVGISEEFLPHIYESFAQEHSQESGQGTGSGLGLTIVKRIVELMGGTIEVKSEKGIGTTFTIVLSLETREQRSADDGETTHDGDANDDSAGATADEGTGLAGKRVLLCEDNDLNAEIAMRLLENKGVAVSWADDGQRGVQMFADSEDGHFDLVLMDVHMPHMDGFEATRRIRKLERADAASVPIIAMTADAYEEDVRKCLDAGMSAHVAKPIDPGRLFRTMREVLDGTAGPSDDAVR